MRESLEFCCLDQLDPAVSLLLASDRSSSMALVSLLSGSTQAQKRDRPRFRRSSMQFPDRARVALVKPWRNLAASPGVHLASLTERLALARGRLILAPVTRSRSPACAPLRPPACPHSRSAHASARPVQKGQPAAQAAPPGRPAPLPGNGLSLPSDALSDPCPCLCPPCLSTGL